MTGLVLELQRDCISGVKVSELLQKSLVIAKKLIITEIEEWLYKELNGYSTKDDFPIYREITEKVSMHNSQLQQGSSDLTQSFNLTATQNDLKTVIDELKGFISNPNLKPEQIDEVNEAIATLEIQEKSAKPKLAIIRESVQNVRGIMDTLRVTPESIVSFLTSMPQF